MAVGGCNERGGGGGGGSNAEMVCIVCPRVHLLSKASKIWEVGRKSVGSRQEVGRNSFANRYRTRSKESKFDTAHPTVPNSLLPNNFQA